MPEQPPPLRNVAPLVPLSAVPLEYVPPATANRPGLVTAIGVISIVVSVLSGLASVGFGISGVSLWIMSTIRMPRAAAVTASVKTSAGPNLHRLSIGPRGLAADRRATVITALRRNHNLTEARVQMLDAILADSGEIMFSFGGEAINGASVVASISDSGQVHQLNGGAGPDFFVLGTGRLELYDDHAVFMPSDGSETVRVSADELVAQGSALKPAQVESILQRARRLSGERLNPAQLASLKTALESDPPALVDPSNKLPLQSQVTAVQLQPNGMVMIRGATGFLNMDQNGLVLSAFAGGKFSGSPGAGVPFNVAPGASLLVVAVSLISLGLAVFLLVAGILTLRQSLRGRSLHLIYATVKIPLVLLAMFAVYWMFSSLLSTLSSWPAASAPNRNARVAAAFFYAGFVGLGLIYPIALLIALNTRRLREYYLSAR
jgi:hypothetical protein